MATSEGAGPASGSPLQSDVRDRLESVRENTDLLSRQINGGGGGEFHTRLKLSAEQVSSAYTKLAVLFSKAPPPSPSDCGCVCQNLEQATLQLVTILFQITQDQGRTLVAEVKSNILNVLAEVRKLVEVLIKEGCASQHSRQRGTGTLWASCDMLAKVSQDNKSAIAKVCLSQLRLLQDARTEAEELQSKGGEAEDDMFGEDSEKDIEDISDRLMESTLEGTEGGEGVFRWSEADMTTVTPCLSLVQASVGVTKTTCRGVVTSGGVASVDALDRVAEEVRLLSPLVDDIVSELPAPINTSLISQLSVKLGEHLLQFMDTVDACGFHHHGNDETAWTRHRETVKHALTKIQQHR